MDDADCPIGKNAAPPPISGGAVVMYEVYTISSVTREANSAGSGMVAPA